MISLLNTSMHHIQLKILRNLLYDESSNYAALRPEGIESNHFAYHLERLMQDKFIRKDDQKRYWLTDTGLGFVDRMTQGTMKTRLQPIIITAIDLTTPDGKTLLFQRQFQPYIYRVGFPIGRLHLEETVLQAATRELREKTGLQDIPLTHRGVVYVDAVHNGRGVSKMLYHVFHGDVQEPLPLTMPNKGVCFWADHHGYTPDQLMPGFLGIKALLESESSFFFRELTESRS